MSAPRIELEGARIAITGAGRGIGRATAAAFAARGARVAIGDLDADAAESAATELGARARGFALDVTDRESFARFLAEAGGDRVDVLVNNAGVMPSGRFLDEDDATSRLTIDVNLWGPINGMRLALPPMVARGRGHVVNVASMAGKIHVAGLGVYVASKHAVVGLTASVREELEGSGVTASAILPTAVNTELASGFPLAGLFPVEPEDVAAAIVESCESRAAEIAVPRLVGLLPPVEAVVPSGAMRLARKLLRPNRALESVDTEARAEYLERMERHTAANEARAEIGG